MRVKEETEGTASSKPKKKTEVAISKGMGPSFFFLLHAAWSALWCSVDVEDDDVGVLSYVNVNPALDFIRGTGEMEEAGSLQAGSGLRWWFRLICALLPFAPIRFRVETRA